MRKPISILFITGILFCGNARSNNPPEESILVPQTGYQSGMQKLAVIRSRADSFHILGADGSVRLRGALSPEKKWPFSDEMVCQADLSAVSTPGKYTIILPGTDISREFLINADPFDVISGASVKALFYNRCSYGITEEFGGKWQRKGGHFDTRVLIHSTAVSEGRPEGYVISSPGGWYDAGDYNKYIVNSGISVYTLMLAYDLFPEYWKKTGLQIPESKNNIPDLLDELLFNLRWMLTMQDKDGGVYHKLTTLAFEPFVMPDKANATRYVIYKSTAAGLDFAAVMSHASRLFAGFDKELPGLSDSCRVAAEHAWEWCNKNPGVIFRNPKDVSTGEYGDNDLRDEWYWAGVEMSLLSGTAYPDSLMNRMEFKTPTWNSVGTLGLLTTLTNGKFPEEIKSKSLDIFYKYIDQLEDISRTSAYPVSIDYFAWGSNSDVANQGMLKIVGYSLSGNRKYLESAAKDMYYLTGINPTGFCYITGIGEKSPMNIHHRPSGSDGIKEPVPGFLSGGPNTVVMTDCPNAKRSKFPALSFVDEECSYSTNEIAINWNTPLAFLAGSLSSYSADDKK